MLILFILDFLTFSNIYKQNAIVIFIERICSYNCCNLVIIIVFELGGLFVQHKVCYKGVFCFSMKAFTCMWNVVVSLLCIYCYSYYSRDFHVCCKGLFWCARGCTPITCMCTANCIDDSEHYNVGKPLLTTIIGLAYICSAHWLGLYENKVHWKNWS